jgi:DNA topoisomerase-6 subunit B
VKHQRDISVSEFFAKNRHLLGFDNPRKALLTTIKEAVDNALDACEEAGILPDIEVKIEEITPPPSPQKPGRYRVTVTDNGPGIVRRQVENIFGKLLYGSKFHRLKMSPRPAGHRHLRRWHVRPDDHRQLGTLMAMLQDARGQTVSSFLQTNFSRVTQQVTNEILGAAKVSSRASSTSVPPSDVEKIYRAIQDTKIMSPPTNCLSPIGEEALAKGLYWLFVEARKERDAVKQAEKAAASGEDSGQLDLLAGDAAEAAKASAEAKKAAAAEGDDKNTADELAAVKLNADGAIESEEEDYFVTAVTRPPSVYRGNPFQIEVGLFYGKGLPADELARVYRFANRVPLQYQASACAMSKAVMSVPWRNYEVQQSRGAPPTGPLVIMVHIASGWVPYTSESKEAIASYDEITKELRLAIMECGRKLQRFLRKRKREADEAKKRSYITKYLDPIGDALQEILGLSDGQKQETLGELKEILEKSRPSAGKKKPKKKKAPAKKAGSDQPAA